MTSQNPTNMKGDHRSNILSKPQTDIIKTWYKQLHNKAPPSNNKWIVKEHKSIVDKVIERTEKPYSVNSRKTHFSVLAKVCRLETNPDRLDNPLFIKYSKISTELGKQDEKKREGQTLTEDEKNKWIPFSQLKEMVEKNYEHMLDGSIEKMYKGLISAIYFWHPPVRVDYADVKIVKKAPKDKRNFMIKHDGKYTVYLRDYKMYWKMGEAQLHFSTDLSKLVDETLEFLPRKYLLTPADNVNKPLGKSQLQKSITNIFGFSIDVLRKIYGSHYFKLWQGNKKKLTKLAGQMLHDSKTFFDHYLRFTKGDAGYFSDDDEEGTADIPESSRMAQNRPAITPRTTAKEISTKTEPVKRTIETQTDKERVCGNAPFTPVLYSKLYKQAHPEKTKENNRTYYEKHTKDLLRSKLVRNLNRGHTSAPTQESITKYKLKKTSSGEWV